MVRRSGDGALVAELTHIVEEALRRLDSQHIPRLELKPFAHESLDDAVHGCLCQPPV
jgi:hypothetical protein